MKDEVCSLGVLLDPALSMASQIASVVQYTYFHLKQIAQLHPYLDTGSLNTLVHTLVVSRLDYCNAFCVGLPLGLVRRLQQIPKMVVRLLSGVRKFQHIFPILATLHRLPVCFRSSFKVMILTYKALNGLGP